MKSRWLRHSKYYDISNIMKSRWLRHSKYYDITNIMKSRWLRHDKYYDIKNIIKSRWLRHDKYYDITNDHDINYYDTKSFGRFSNVTIFAQARLKTNNTEMFWTWCNLSSLPPGLDGGTRTLGCPRHPSIEGFGGGKLGRQSICHATNVWHRSVGIKWVLDSNCWGGWLT